MTPERLKELAEAAGLERVPLLNGNVVDYAWAPKESMQWLYFDADPALLPLIAERLVERARKRINYGDSKLLTELAVGSAEDKAEVAYAVLEERD